MDVPGCYSLLERAGLMEGFIMAHDTNTTNATNATIEEVVDQRIEFAKGLWKAKPHVVEVLIDGVCKALVREGLITPDQHNLVHDHIMKRREEAQEREVEEWGALCIEDGIPCS